MLMIAQAIPYIAFAGAAVLVGWVAVDVMRARLRKVKVDGPKAPDYDRGLADKAKPMSTRLQARPIREETYVSDSVLDIPTTQAQDLETEATETEATGPAVEPEVPESAPQEFVPEGTTDTDSERRSPATSAIMYNEAVVKRDASVRVYDALVAPSERRSA
jgi:hypothetical protein